MKRHDIDDTIVAISTPAGEGGIGIVRMSGSKALAIAEAIFVSKDGIAPSKFKTYTTHYGHVKDRKNSVIDEVILTVMRAPKSYTREDIVEINCHGGIQSLKRVLELTIKYGARLAEPGEFTRRAFLNGRIDLTQAEAVLDVIRSKTEGSLKIAMAQLDGDLSSGINAIREEALDIASSVEASIDFPEEEADTGQKDELLERTENIIRKLKNLIDTYDEGMIMREGVLAIICGKPNTGKSSLMNLLLKRDRVIVSPVPGTTRDAVEEMINLKGVPIRLVDTAGISDTRNLVDAEGVRRSKKYLRAADITLLMLDASKSIEKKDIEIINLVKGLKKLVIINKCDLAPKIDRKKIEKLVKPSPVIEISVKNKKNIDALENSILGMIYAPTFTQGESAIITSARHKASLDKAYRSMLSVKKAVKKDLPPELTAVDIKAAVYELGLIVGKSVSEDVLDRIFERFCIGK